MDTSDLLRLNLPDTRITAEDQSCPQSSEFHVDVQGCERLFKKFDANLGLSHLTSREQLIAFQNAAIGFKHLSKLNLHQHAKDWALTFERLGDVTRKQLSEAWLNPNPVARHPLLQVLIDQPAPSRTQEQRKSCLAIGALAFMTIGFQIGRTPANFSAQLKQLFRSSHESWLELSSIDFLDVAALKAWVPLTQVAVVHEFREALGGLHRHAIPSISSFLTPVERAGDTPAIPTTTAVTEENPLQTENPRRSRAKIHSRTSVHGSTCSRCKNSEIARMTLLTAIAVLCIGGDFTRMNSSGLLVD